MKKVYVTYTTPPYYAFFYLPIIALFRKRERLEVAVELRESLGVKGEAHIYDSSRFDVKRLVANDVKRSPVRKKLSKTRLHSLRAEAYSTPEGEALDLASRIWQSLSQVGRVFRVSVVPGRRLILALASPRPGMHIAVVERVLEAVEHARSRVEEARG